MISSQYFSSIDFFLSQFFIACSTSAIGCSIFCNFSSSSPVDLSIAYSFALLSKIISSTLYFISLISSNLFSNSSKCCSSSFSLSLLIMRWFSLLTKCNVLSWFQLFFLVLADLPCLCNMPCSFFQSIQLHYVTLNDEIKNGSDNCNT